MNPIRIAVVGDHPTLWFAAQELARCLSVMSVATCELHRAASACPQERTIRVGLSASFGEEVPSSSGDARWDDALHVNMVGAAGIIAGSNPRSVLMAAYRWLHELGARWSRPGEEHLPRIDLSASSSIVHEAPSYRHRCVCIEGSVDLRHVLDMIDWLPKVGMNAYFLQFRDGFTFFDRWRREIGATPLTGEEARAYSAALVRESKRRDLLLHAVGHGWTCEPFGMPGLGWDYPAPPVPDDVVPLLAEVNGRRALWDGIPLNTNLCYSNPEVRTRMRDAVAAYAVEHPEIDLLHVWLADGANNQCECADCRRTRPSDFYVALLNEIDAELTVRGSAVRIVFLMYVDLLWPPEKERLRNPERFVLMFAPITRTYDHAFEPTGAAGAPPALPSYERNRLVFPRSVDDNVAFLRAWQAATPGVEVVDFDYHLMWDHFYDPSGLRTARVLQRDVQNLAELGMSGFISCQVQRATFPTALSMRAMAAALWNRALEHDALVAQVLRERFGEKSNAALDLLEWIAAVVDPSALRRRDASIVNRLERMQDVRVDRMLEALDGFAEMNVLVEFVRRLCAALDAHAVGDAERTAAAWQDVLKMLASERDRIGDWFDAWTFASTIGDMLDVRGGRR